MKKITIFLISLALGLSTFAQDFICFEWRIKVDENGMALLKKISIQTTPDEEFTIDWGMYGTIETYIGTEDIIEIEYDYGFLDFQEPNTLVYISGLTQNCSFKYFDCSNMFLQFLNIQGKINNLNCKSNELTSLDISFCRILSYLNCSDNELSYLDISNCQELKYLDCGLNNLNNLNLSNNPAIQELRCNQNQLTTLNLSANSSLEKLNCKNNQLSSIVLGNESLTWLNCKNNKLTLLDLYNLSKKTTNPSIFGIQTLPPKNVTTDNILFSEQSVFDGIFTNYTVKNNGQIALETDYTVTDGKLTFHKEGNYTVTMNNEAIITCEYFPAEVEIEIKVIEKVIIHFITALAHGPGDIYPMGLIPVIHGQNQTFTISTYVGCSTIKHLWIDGEEECGASGTGLFYYPFYNVIEDHTIIAEFELKINENEQSNLIIYPNPTNNELRIMVSEFKNFNYEFQLFDIQGKKISLKKKVKSKTESEVILDISHLKTGIYFLKINNQITKIIKL